MLVAAISGVTGQQARLWRARQASGRSSTADLPCEGLGEQAKISQREDGQESSVQLYKGCSVKEELKIRGGGTAKGELRLQRDATGSY